VLIVLSYFISYACSELGFFLTGFTYFVFKKEKKEKIKKTFSKLVNFINQDTYVLDPDEILIKSHREAIEYFKETVYIKSMFDDAEIRFLIARSYLGFIFLSTSIALFLSKSFLLKYLLIAMFLLLTYSCFTRYRLSVVTRRLNSIYKRVSAETSTK
jgi:hypothetical protein